MNIMNGIRPTPYAKIIYEPTSVYRMRYEAENRNTCLLAENIDNSNNIKIYGRRKPQNPEGIYPRVQIVDGKGPATLIVSCVNKSPPYHVHPHKLIGPSCKSGVAVINIQEGETFFDLKDVSIQFTKKSDIEKSIEELKNKNVDPFNVGFDFDRNSIDLFQIRLCFQIYLRDSLESGEIIRDQYHILKPIVSQIISNTSRKTTLSIIKTFNLHSSCDGGSTVILLIKKLEKEQRPIQAKFYDQNGWSAIVNVNESNIHYQSTVYFYAPKYDRQIDKDVTVFLKLIVPFTNQNEKDKYIKALDEDEDESILDTTINSSAQNVSCSSSSHIPDGKYESRQIEFVYKPKITNLCMTDSKKRKYTEEFYGFSEQADKDAISEINVSTRRNLINRQIELNNSIGLNVSSFVQNQNIPDPIVLNNTMVYSISSEDSLPLSFSSTFQSVEQRNYPFPNINDNIVDENNFQTFVNHQTDNFENSFNDLDVDVQDYDLDTLLSIIIQNN